MVLEGGVTFFWVLDIFTKWPFFETLKSWCTYEWSKTFPFLKKRKRKILNKSKQVTGYEGSASQIYTIEAEKLRVFSRKRRETGKVEGKCCLHLNGDCHNGRYCRLGSPLPVLSFLRPSICPPPTLLAQHKVSIFKIFYLVKQLVFTFFKTINVFIRMKTLFYLLNREYPCHGSFSRVGIFSPWCLDLGTDRDFFFKWVPKCCYITGLMGLLWMIFVTFVEF